MTTVNIVGEKTSKEEGKKYSIGDFFYHPDYPDSVCLLVQSEVGKVSMITVVDGDANRFDDPFEVDFVYGITQEEFHNITGGDPHSFTKISNVTITYSI